jgi:hypothetical protein
MLGMGILKWIGEFVGKEMADDLLGNVKDKISETIEDTQEKVEQVTKHVIKSLTLLLIFFLGLIFLLVGVSQSLEDKVASLTPGLGFVVVGGVLVILTIIVKALK